MIAEIQAFENGINVAKGTANSSSVTSSSNLVFGDGSVSYTHEIITDGNTTVAQYVELLVQVNNIYSLI